MNNLPTATLTLDTAWIGEAPEEEAYQPSVFIHEGMTFDADHVEAFHYRDARVFELAWREMNYTKHDNADLNKLLDEIAERP